jgi:hypothetical protein
MHDLLRLVFGRATWPHIVIMLVPALGCGGFIWYASGASYDFATALCVLVTIDLVAGAISNATLATNRQWQRQPVWHRWIFVLVHVSIYPLGIWALATPPAARMVLLCILVLKVALFIRGSWWRRMPASDPL